MQTVDAEIGKLLFEALAATGAEDLRAPLAVAVGLGKEPAHGPRLRQLVVDRAHNERFAGYLCTGLGLLGDPAAIPDLVKCSTARGGGRSCCSRQRWPSASSAIAR